MTNEQLELIKAALTHSRALSHYPEAVARHAEALRIVTDALTPQPEPAWRRLLDEEQQSQFLDEIAECVRDDPRGYAELDADSITEEGVSTWLKELADEY